ncbi:hypothetical protein DL98DRAFT_555122 [Cadophora sp. DSE1049]|nr:hypothetical protein DL98DRAFT_555122 [Cadophora sp. DSE1049]
MWPFYYKQGRTAKQASGRYGNAIAKHGFQPLHQRSLSSEFGLGNTRRPKGSSERALLKAKANFEILALTRNTQSASAQKLLPKSATIKLVAGNLDTIEDVFKKAREAAKAPIWGVFSVRVSLMPLSKSVYSSVDRGGSKSDNNPTNIPHFIRKHRIEEYLFDRTRGTDMSYTVLRPVAFFENLIPGFVAKVFTTSWQTILGKEQKTATDRDQRHRVFWCRITGGYLPTTYTLIAGILNRTVNELGYVFKWFRDVGYGADIPRLKTLNPDLKDFKTWLATESAWKRKQIFCYNGT